MGQIVFQATLGGQTALVGQNTASSYSLTLPLATDTLVGRGTTDTLSNKTLISPVISSIVNTGTLTLPTSTDTLVGRATTDTLTNKTLTSPTITSPTITGGTSTATQNLTNVTGTLGTSYGGTGLSTYSLGQIFFGATSNFGQSSNLYWDNTNNRLGLGTSTPSYTLDIAPSSTNVISRVLASGSNSNAYSIYTSNNAINNPVTLYVGSLGSSVGALIGTYTNSDLVFGTNNQTNIMRFNTSGILSVPTLNLTNALTVPYGGTGLTSLTAGYIPYGNGTSAFSSSSNLFWDGTNNRLGIGTSSPANTLDVRGTAINQSDGTYGNVKMYVDANYGFFQSLNRSPHLLHCKYELPNSQCCEISVLRHIGHCRLAILPTIPPSYLPGSSVSQGPRVLHYLLSIDSKSEKSSSDANLYRPYNSSNWLFASSNL